MKKVEISRAKRFRKKAFSMLSTPTTSREKRLMQAKQNEAVIISRIAVVLLFLWIVMVEFTQLFC